MRPNTGADAPTVKLPPPRVILATNLVVAVGALAWVLWDKGAAAMAVLAHHPSWPLFAAFCVYAYRKFVRYEVAPPELNRPDVVTEIPAGLLPERPSAAPTDDDPATREYNAYLAELAANDQQNQKRTTA